MPLVEGIIPRPHLRALFFNHDFLDTSKAGKPVLVKKGVYKIKVPEVRLLAEYKELEKGYMQWTDFLQFTLERMSKKYRV